MNDSVNYGGASFDLDCGTVVYTEGPDYVSSGLKPVGNGWYRVWMVQVKTGGEDFDMGYYLNTDSGTWEESYLGTEKNLFLWGLKMYR